MGLSRLEGPLADDTPPQTWDFENEECQYGW